MDKIQITYDGIIYSGAFKIEGNIVVVYCNKRKRAAHVMGSPENIKAIETLAKQFLEDLIRPPNKRPTDFK